MPSGREEQSYSSSELCFGATELHAYFCSEHESSQPVRLGKPQVDVAMPVDWEACFLLPGLHEPTSGLAGLDVETAGLQHCASVRSNFKMLFKNNTCHPKVQVKLSIN